MKENKSPTYSIPANYIRRLKKDSKVGISTKSGILKKIIKNNISLDDIKFDVCARPEILLPNSDYLIYQQVTQQFEISLYSGHQRTKVAISSDNFKFISIQTETAHLVDKHSLPNSITDMIKIIPKLNELYNLLDFISENVLKTVDL